MFNTQCVSTSKSSPAKSVVNLLRFWVVSLTGFCSHVLKKQKTFRTKEYGYIGEYTILRQFIIGVQCCYSHAHERYQVKVSTVNPNEYVIYLFDTFAKAKELKGEISKWIQGE